MRRWLGVDASELPIEELRPLVDDAIAIRDLDVAMYAEAIATALGGKKKKK